MSGTSGDVVIVGAGPIGLAHAWGIKKLNPEVKVVVLEKYEEYQRKHTLIMQHQQLSKLMCVTATEQDPDLSNLLVRLKKNAHIRTSELETIFKKLAIDNGVTIVTETVEEKTIEAQLCRQGIIPDLIIGADGTHSVVSRGLFAEGNQVKHEFDYVLQLRYEISADSKDSKSNQESMLSFYQRMARHGLVANEYVGASSNGKVPVTMQMMISRESFYALREATSKRPIRPLVTDEKTSADAESKDPLTTSADAEISDLGWESLPSELQTFITDYLGEKLKNNENKIDKNSIRISVNEAPATHAKKVADFRDLNGAGNVPILLAGDAGLGLSYFKGLNAGIESTAQLLLMLRPTIQAGLNDQPAISKALRYYQNWFLNDFAPRKIEEVAQYSKWRIRSAMGAMRFARSMKMGSMVENEYDNMELINSYFRLLAQDSFAENARNRWQPYPHRPHNLIKLGQFSYIPIIYSLAKTIKLFTDYFKPYKSSFQLRQDFKQPLVGIVNLSSGLMKIIIGLFTLNLKRFADGIFSTFRGAIEIATTPLAWFIKPITRSFASLIASKKSIENNRGMQKLVQHGLQLLDAVKQKDQLSNEEIYALFAVCDDLHRKFNKSIKRGQYTNIGKLEETTEFYAASASIYNKSECKNQFRKYFLLFAKIENTRSNLALSYYFEFLLGLLSAGTAGVFIYTTAAGLLSLASASTVLANIIPLGIASLGVAFAALAFYFFVHGPYNGYRAQNAKENPLPEKHSQSTKILGFCVGVFNVGLSISMAILLGLGISIFPGMALIASILGVLTPITVGAYLLVKSMQSGQGAASENFGMATSDDSAVKQSSLNAPLAELTKVTSSRLTPNPANQDGSLPRPNN